MFLNLHGHTYMRLDGTANTHVPHGPVNTHPQMAKMLDVLGVFLNLHC